MVFKEYYRYVLDWATGELSVEKAIEVVYECTDAEREAACKTCRTVEKYGMDACCGCAG